MDGRCVNCGAGFLGRAESDSEGSDSEGESVDSRESEHQESEDSEDDGFIVPDDQVEFNDSSDSSEASEEERVVVRVRTRVYISDSEGSEPSIQEIQDVDQYHFPISDQESVAD